MLSVQIIAIYYEPPLALLGSFEKTEILLVEILL